MQSGTRRAAVYCRVSTGAQAENGTSLESQRDACLKLASARGYVVPEDLILLEDWTGADLERPKLELAREAVRNGSIGALICYSVDRLARDPIHVGIIAEECAKREAELLFVLEPLDNSPEGALIRYVKGYAAQIERERIKERTIRGKRSRARQGYLVQGTGKGIYGYRYMPEAKKRAIYEPEAQIVRRMFEACVAGESCYSIAVSLNREGVPALGGGLWHPLTVKRILTNPSYKGKTLFGQTRRIALGGNRRRLERRNPEEWIEIPGATPAIIAESLFDAAQEALGRPKRNPAMPMRKYLLTGFIECACGAPIVGTTLNKTYHYYRCRSTWPTATRPKTCDAPYIKAKVLENEVWEVIRQVLKHPELVIEEIKERQGNAPLLEMEIARVRAAIQRLADQEKRVIRLYGVGQVTEDYVLREAEQIKKARRAKEEELANLQRQQAQLQHLEGLADRVREFCSQITARTNGFDFEEKRLALQALQVKVVVGKDGARLMGAVPTNLATIEQTWASQRECSRRC